MPLLPPGLPPDDECHQMLALRQAEGLLRQIAESDKSELSLQAELRKKHPASIVSAALTLLELRRKGAVKFPCASQMWFDRRGLEQATSEPVARHKAARFSGEIDDLCCGIGGDSVALAGQGDVRSVDLNPAACLRTWWNAEVYECQSRVEVVCDDVVQQLSGDRLVHIDPDRRPDGNRRVPRIEDCSPNKAFLEELIVARPGGAIKLSPAANFTGKFPGSEIELVSLNGECKEAIIWFGELGEPDLWRATSLPTGETLSGNPLQAYAQRSVPLKYIYDPDPAIVRSGLIELLCESLDLARLDEAEEYLTSDRLVRSPFVSAFEILETLPYKAKQLRAWFRTADIAQVEIKCRHLPVPVEQLRKKLSLSGTLARTLIVAKIADRSTALVCRRVDEV